VNVESVHQANGHDGWQELLVEDRRATPAEIAVTRIDFRAWLESLSGHDRRVAEVLASGESTQLTAKRFGVSTGRISQLRRKLHMAWRAFQGEADSIPLSTAPCG
jgi:hypothetical protein